jgi:hypothetical protein
MNKNRRFVLVLRGKESYRFEKFKILDLFSQSLGLVNQTTNKIVKFNNKKSNKKNQKSPPFLRRGRGGK